ncbi:hypothetical protein CHBEV_028 [Choristoneura biennis entomopoxvirus]|uniref:Uncharacterized protein n=1 Tax=Choristoneura biennis entomopoxvirus TaxID=10288 RepID=A0A916KPE0_CBEPV|nr:hypothetical protein CHBEV_028 [Choristoneura biennis entomopoxvirus]CCU55596.1 hypothetical protein CHBEV_028 [Choristoneura biennis entomopoxvirus]
METNYSVYYDLYEKTINSNHNFKNIKGDSKKYLSVMGYIDENYNVYSEILVFKLKLLLYIIHNVYTGP